MKYYNALYSVHEFLDDGQEDYDVYTIGVQVKANSEESAIAAMGEVIADYILNSVHGAGVYFIDFCTEAEFDIYGVDVF